MDTNGAGSGTIAFEWYNTLNQAYYTDNFNVGPFGVIDRFIFPGS